MRRVLRGAVGTLLVGGIFGLTRPAPAQSPYVLQEQATPIRKVGYKGNAVRPNGRNRLEEMKVELALLADVTTFPYYLGGRVVGKNLELQGYVPNDMVRQRALRIALGNTSLKVVDGLKIQAGLNVRPSVRGIEVLQREGAELLTTRFGEFARGMRVEARSDGVVTLTGTIKSLEDKLSVYKLFRQLSGCAGVIDRLTIQPILHDGQRVVPVMRDGSLTAPASGAIAQTAKPAPQPVRVQASKRAPSSLDAQDDELRLPTIVSGKASSIQAAAATAKHDNVGALKPPAPVMKWEQPAAGRENAESSGKPAKAAAKTSPALTKPIVPWAADMTVKAADVKPIKPPPPVRKWGQPAMSWESQIKPKRAADAAKDAVVKTVPASPIDYPESKSTKKSKPDVFAEQHQSTGPGSRSTGSSVALTAPAAPLRWQRPGGSEASEPRIEPLTKPVPAPATPPAPAPSSPAVRPAVDPPMPDAIIRKAPAAAPEPIVERWVVPNTGSPSSRREAATISPVVRLDRPSRWPPAYDVLPAQPKNGRPGIIVFDDEPAPEPAPAKAAPPAPHGAVPAELRRQIAAVCGPQARDVHVEQQRDGSVQVRVKVASSSIGDQLTHKILTIPAMASPRVHLTMDISP